MNEHSDIPAARDLPPGWLQRRKEQLVQELAQQEGFARRRRRRLVLALAPAAFVLLAATGFATYALTREPTQLETIGCFGAADVSSSTAIVRADGRDPVTICAELWRQGAVGDAPAPERLAACVLESGPVGVFPSSGPTTCARLGLADVPAGYALEAKRFAGLRDAIVAHLGEPASGTSPGSTTCLGEDAARAAVRRELDVHGYVDWKVEVAEVDGGGFTAERPCAEASFDGKRRVVVLVPVWP